MERLLLHNLLDRVGFLHFFGVSGLPDEHDNRVPLPGSDYAMMVFGKLNEDCMTYVLERCDKPSLVALARTSKGAAERMRPFLVRDVQMKSENVWVDVHNRILRFCETVIQYQLEPFIRNLELGFLPEDEHLPRVANMLGSILKKATGLVSFIPRYPSYGFFLIEPRILDVLVDHPPSLVRFECQIPLPDLLSGLRSMRGGLRMLNLSFGDVWYPDAKEFSNEDIFTVVRNSADTLVHLSLYGPSTPIVTIANGFPLKTVMALNFSSASTLPVCCQLSKLELWDAMVDLAFIRTIAPRLRFLVFRGRCVAIGETPMESSWPDLLVLRGDIELVLPILNNGSGSLQRLTVFSKWNNRRDLPRLFDVLQRSSDLRALSIHSIQIADESSHLAGSISEVLFCNILTPRLRVLELSFEGRTPYGTHVLIDLLSMQTTLDHHVKRAKDLVYVSLSVELYFCDSAPQAAAVANLWFSAVPSLKYIHFSICSYGQRGKIPAQDTWFQRVPTDGLHPSQLRTVQISAQDGKAACLEILGSLSELDHLQDVVRRASSTRTNVSNIDLD